MAILRFDGALTTQELRDAVIALEGARIPIRTLSDWARTGLVPATVAPARGRRLERLYGRSDLLRARLVVRLRGSGLSIQRIRVVLAFIARDLQEALASWPGCLEIDEIGGTARLVRNGRRMDVVKNPGQYTLPLSELRAGLDVVARRMEGAA